MAQQPHPYPNAPAKTQPITPTTTTASSSSSSSSSSKQDNANTNPLGVVSDAMHGLVAQLNQLQLQQQHQQQSSSYAFAAGFSPVHDAQAASPFRTLDVDLSQAQTVQHNPLQPTETFRSVLGGQSGASGSHESSEDSSSFQWGGVAMASPAPSSAFGARPKPASAAAAAASAASASSLQLAPNPFQPVKAAAGFGFAAASPFLASFAAAEEASADSLPPPHPGWLELNYHFAIDTRAQPSASALLTDLAPLLVERHVDFGPYLEDDEDNHSGSGHKSKQVQPFKLLCRAYGSNNAAIPFVVSIYRNDNDGKDLVMEFQRRSGDVTEFTAVYSAIKKQLQERGVAVVPSGSLSPTTAAASSLVTSATTQASAATGELTGVYLAGGLVAPPSLQRAGSMACPPLKLDDAEGNAPSEQDRLQTAANLLQMAGSDMLDVKTEALQQLSALSAQADFATVLTRCMTNDDSSVPDLTAHAVVATFKDSLYHADADVHRLALTTLANVTAIRAGSGSELKVPASLLSAVDAMARDEVAKQCGELLQRARSQRVKREALRLLANLTDLYGCAAVSTSVVSGAVSNGREMCVDPIARDQVEKLAKALQTAPTTSKGSLLHAEFSLLATARIG